MKRWIFYVGTYASSDGGGIYRFTLNEETGEIAGGDLALELPDAKYMAGDGGAYLAAAYGFEDNAGVCLSECDNQNLLRTSVQRQGKKAPCFVGFFDNRLISANYHEGTVHIYDYKNGRLQLEKKILIGTGAGCHQVLICGSLLLVPCLELDTVRLFDEKHSYAPAGEILFPPGSGPRHGVLNEKQTRLWMVGERDNNLYEFHVSEEGQFFLGHVVPIFPQQEGEKSLSAAIRLSPDERFLVISTRGRDCLTTFCLTKEGPQKPQSISCGGRQPRDIFITIDGHFILVANRGSGEVVCFWRDREGGLIKGESGRITIPEAASILCWTEERL